MLRNESKGQVRFYAVNILIDEGGFIFTFTGSGAIDGAKGIEVACLDGMKAAKFCENIAWRRSGIEVSFVY